MKNKQINEQSLWKLSHHTCSVWHNPGLFEFNGYPYTCATCSIMPEDVQIQAETCGTYVRITTWIKINPCCVSLNKCGLLKQTKHGC